MTARGPSAFAVSPSECEASLEQIRSVLRRNLIRMEEDFVRCDWNYFKVQEMWAVPIWQAVWKKKDTFSPAVRAEGEILYERYGHEAGELERELENQSRSFFAEWRSVKETASRLKEGCPVSAFQICIEEWLARFGESLRELDKGLRRYDKEQREFLKKMQKAIEESPSEHLDFAARRRQWQEVWDRDKFYSEFQVLLRELREGIDYEGSAPPCCSRCRSEDGLAQDDPVLSRLKPDPQGTEGVAGQMVNQAGLAKAFEEMENTQD